MKSKIEDLQCPCGCELGVSTRTEMLYQALVEFGFVVSGRVNCETGVTDTLAVAAPRDMVLDKQTKFMAALRSTVGFDCVREYDYVTCTWMVKLVGDKGVRFHESV